MEVRDTLTLTKRRNVDTTTGPIFSNMIYFAIPLMLTKVWKRYKATVRDGDPALEKTT